MPKIIIHNVETDQVIEREMNAEELARYEAFQASIRAEKEDARQKEIARENLLARLGITEEEAKLLLS